MELMYWFKHSFGESINYKTLTGYVKRKFGAQVKTARKSHVKKEPDAVQDLKRTSSYSAKS